MNLDLGIVLSKTDVPQKLNISLFFTPIQSISSVKLHEKIRKENLVALKIKEKTYSNFKSGEQYHIEITA